MELTPFNVGVLVALVFIIAQLFGRRGEKLSARDPESRRLPVVDNSPLPAVCETCDFFSLDGGRQIMEANPAFAAAATTLPPWQMGRPREVKPNPEYDALEARMTAAGEEGDYALQGELHEELLKLRPGELLPPESYLPRQLLDLQWEDFGACGKRSELRAKTDTCDLWVWDGTK